jgi:hypothetical protein
MYQLHNNTVISGYNFNKRKSKKKDCDHQDWEGLVAYLSLQADLKLP